MKLSEFRKKSNENTAKASEITRQLSLGGIAIIWLFKNSEQSQSLLNPYLILPLLYLSISILFDLAQYFIAGQVWISFFREKEKEFSHSKDDPDIKAPKYLNIPIYICYYTKIILMICAYFHIIFFIISKL
jgi:hypothetical protein